MSISTILSEYYHYLSHIAIWHGSYANFKKLEDGLNLVNFYNIYNIFCE